MSLAMLLIICTWLIAFLLFSGVGLLLRRTLKLPLNQGADWVFSFWIGHALVICGLQVWHVMLSVNLEAWGVIAVIGCMGLVVYRRELWLLCMQQTQMNAMW